MISQISLILINNKTDYFRRESDFSLIRISPIQQIVEISTSSCYFRLNAIFIGIQVGGVQ